MLTFNLARQAGPEGAPSPGPLTPENRTWPPPVEAAADGDEGTGGE